MSFTILFVVSCGGAFAANENIEVVDDIPPELAQECVDDVPLEVMALPADGQNAVMLASASNTSAPCTITFNNPVRYGVSGAMCSTASGTFSGSLGKTNTLGTFQLASAETGLYIQADQLTAMVNWDVSASYPDVESLDIYGTARGYMYVGDGKNFLYANSTKAHLYVNGSPVGEDIPYGSDFSYSYKLGIGETVKRVGLLFTFGDVFDLKATADLTSVRSLYFVMYSANSSTPTTNSNNSTSGWFNQLFDWLSDIRDGISNVVSGISSGFSNVVNAITSLPQKISDAIKSLFVPSDEQLEELRTSFNNLLETKLGFVYQAGSLVDGVLDAVFEAVDNPNYNASFTIPAFPAFHAGGTAVQLWDAELTVDFSQNEFVTTAQNIAYPFVIALMVWAFVHSMEDAFLAFVGGKSLIDWIRNREGRKEE